MPEKDDADQLVEVDQENEPLSDNDLEAAAGGIKPPTLLDDGGE